MLTESQYIIRILSFWYANQQMWIRWGGTYSTSFNVSNGVRLGSILSPYLFNMIFNQKKSASEYLISKTLKGAHLPNVYLNGEVIVQDDSVKYLGHHLTNDLHDDLDIRRQCRAINVRGNILFLKFHMCSVSVKLKLFNYYCASMYTPHLWWY